MDWLEAFEEQLALVFWFYYEATRIVLIGYRLVWGGAALPSPLGEGENAHELGIVFGPYV